MNKTFLTVILFAVIIALTGCQEKTEINRVETGVVVDYAGTGHCGVIIELDNGNKIQPLHYPGEFDFTHGQRVLVEYVELPDVIPTCDNGTACDILHVEEIDCGAPVTELFSHNYDSLANDPVFLHEVYIENECLHLKLSYSGGCREHTVNLARVNSEKENNEDTTVLEVRHNANNDACEAVLTNELNFNLSSLKEDGITQFLLVAQLANGETYEELFEME